MVPRGASDLRATFARAVSGVDFERMRSGGIVVAFAQSHAWLPWLPEARALLAPDEAGRVEKYRSAPLREARTIAYSLHRLLLGAQSGGDPVDVRLVRDERGCPRIPGDFVHTSLSHAEGCIAMAVSSAGPVGIDLEPADRMAVMPEIAARVCHPSEVAALGRLAGSDYNAALLALWVRKESLLKAAGIGLGLEMNRFPELGGAFQIGTTPVRAWMIDAGKGWVAAIATRPGATVSTVWLCPDAGHPG